MQTPYTITVGNFQPGKDLRITREENGSFSILIESRDGKQELVLKNEKEMIALLRFMVPFAYLTITTDAIGKSMQDLNIPDNYELDVSQIEFLKSFFKN